MRFKMSGRAMFHNGWADGGRPMMGHEDINDVIMDARKRRVRCGNGEYYIFECDEEQASYIAKLSRDLGAAWMCDGSDTSNGRELVRAAEKIERQLKGGNHDKRG